MGNFILSNNPSYTVRIVDDVLIHFKMQINVLRVYTNSSKKKTKIGVTSGVIALRIFDVISF